MHFASGKDVDPSAVAPALQMIEAGTVEPPAVSAVLGAPPEAEEFSKGFPMFTNYGMFTKP